MASSLKNELIVVGYLWREQNIANVKIPAQLHPLFITFCQLQNEWNPDDCNPKKIKWKCDMLDFLAGVPVHDRLLKVYRGVY